VDILLIARFCVTEIGEKEKMKNKILASVIVATLLIGMFAGAIAFSPIAHAIEEHNLSLFTSPIGIPLVGAGLYTEGSYVNLTAPDPYTIGNKQYVFNHWDFDNVYAGNTAIIWLQMNTHSDRNATAYYSTSYQVTIADPALPGVTVGIFVDGGPWLATGSTFVPNNTVCWIGVKGLWSSPAGVYIDPDKWIYLINFTVNGVPWGVYVSGADPSYYCSGSFIVTGPVAGDTTWGMLYQLHVSNTQNPPVPTPAGAGWYYAGTIATLNAPEYNPGGGRRYIIDHWTVDGSTVAGNPINVTMNTNHTAVAIFKRQSFVYLEDNLGNFSGIQDTGKWYDDGVNYTFVAPTPLSVGPGVRYDFRFWDKPGYGWTSTSNPLIVAFDASWDGEHLRGRWQTQYYLGLFSSPTISGYLYTDSDMTGWYDAGATVNLKAHDMVQIDANTRYVFIQWKNHLGGTNPNNNITFAMMQPWGVTAEYKLEYLAKWKALPASITVAGFPGQAWIDNGTWISYIAPMNDIGSQYVFFDWTINAFTYNQGNTTIPLFVTGPVDGTAYYANETKLSMTPDSHYETSPAYCHRFNVTIAASNFDANRLVGGQPMDIYAFEFKIKWDTSLLEVTNVYLNLNAFFAPNAYFIAKNEIGAGYFLIAATVKGNYTGFSGTKPMFTMEFHVIRDACYPQVLWSWIYFDYIALSNHLGNGIWPELGYNNCYYQITAPLPTLEIRNAIDHTNVVTIQKNVPTSYFDVEVYLHDGVKVHDFWVQVIYNAAQISAESVVINNYLKAPYTIYHWDTSVAGVVVVQVVQDSSVALQNGSGVLFTIHFKVVGTKIWTTASPGPLTSFITIDFAYLSVMCPTPAYQQTNTYGGNGYLGVLSNCQYNYNALPGDLNFDGVVNVLDLQLIADNYHTPTYDIVVNGDTDLYDLVFVALRFGNHV
jgi:hypothetical protein